MKNKLRFTTILACGAMLLAGCGQSGPTAKYTVQFWHCMGKTNQGILNSIITKFNTFHPDIAISPTQQGGYNDIKDKLLQAIPAGTAPTMAACYPDHVANYLTASAVVQLDDYFESTEEFDGETLGFKVEDGSHVEGGETLYGVDDFVSAFWTEGQQYSVDGTYSVPQAKSTEVLFYNKTFFDAHSLPVPTKWENNEDPNDLTAFANLAVRIKEIVINRGDEWGGAEGYRAMGYDSDDNLFISFSKQLGIPYTTQSEVKAERYPFGTSIESKNMVRLVKEWYDEGYLTTGDVCGGFTSDKFTTQKLFMAVGSTGGTRYNNSENFDVGVAKIPQWDSENVATISQGPSLCFFKQATKDQLDAAWLFYRYFTEMYDTLAYAISTGYEPVRISAYQNEIFQTHVSGIDPSTGEAYGPRSESLLYSKVAAITQTMTEDYFVSPVFKGSSTAREQVGSIITDVLLGTKTIDKAFEDALGACIFAS